MKKSEKVAPCPVIIIIKLMIKIVWLAGAKSMKQMEFTAL